MRTSVMTIGFDRRAGSGIIAREASRNPKGARIMSTQLETVVETQEVNLEYSIRALATAARMFQRLSSDLLEGYDPRELKEKYGDLWFQSDILVDSWARILDLG